MTTAAGNCALKQTHFDTVKDSLGIHDHLSYCHFIVPIYPVGRDRIVVGFTTTLNK
jgi:hypothetical protein